MAIVDRHDGKEYQSIFENAIEGIFQSSLDGRFLKVNPAMARIYGYDSPNDMLTSIRNIEKQIYVNAQDREDFLLALQEIGFVDRFEGQHYRKDGSIFWTQMNARIVRDAEGNALFIEGFITDITTRKEAEFALQASEERFRALVEHLPAILFMDAVDEAESTIYIGPKIESILGYTPEEWDKEVFWKDILHPDDRERVLAEDELTHNTGKSFRMEYRLRAKNGRYVWISEETDLIKSEDGRPKFWLGFLLDITDRKQAEEATHQSEEHFSKIFQAIPIASLISTLAEGRFIAANDAYWNLSGFEPDEILNRTSIELGFISKKERKKFIARILKEKSIRNEIWKIITKNGETRNTLEFYDLISFDGQDCVLSMFYDMTDQVEAQNALRENEEKYRQLFESESDAIFLIDNESGNILEVNDAATALYGYSKDELLHMKNSDLSAEPEVTRRVTQKTPIIQEKIVSIPLRFHRKKDGIVFPVEITGRFFERRGRPVHIAAIRDITERKKSEAAVQRQLEELTILHDIALTASSSKGLDELIKRATDIIYDSLHPDNCGIELVTESGDMYQAHPSYRGASKNEIRELLPISRGATGKVISTGKPIRLGDVSQDKAYIEVTEDVRSELCVPIMIQNRVIGAFNIESKKAKAYTKSDERLLTTIAGTLATAIEQMRLFETSRRQLQELTILNAISLASTKATSLDELIENVTQIIGESFYSDNFGVLLLNEDDSTLTPHPSYRGISIEDFPKRFSLDRGICGEVAASGKPIRIANVRTHKKYIEVTSQVRSELCVPINLANRVLGVINAESVRINAFTRDDEQLLTTIASTLATAIEKLRLLEVEKKRRQEAETLLEATTTLTTSLNLENLLDSILELISKIVHYETASIAIEQGNKLHIVAGRGFPKSYNIIGRQLEYSEKWLLLNTTHQPIILPDAQLDPRFEKWEGSEYIRGWMGVPMVVHDKLIGYINLDSRTPNFFTQEDAIRAQTFANSSAVAIENARLFEAEKKSRVIAEALREATATLTTSIDPEELYEIILDAIAKLVPFDSASIEILDQGYLEIVAGRDLRNKNCIGKKYQYKSTTSGDWETFRQPIIIPDVQEDDRFEKLEGSEYIRGWMGVPMFVQDRLIGFLNFDSSTKDFFTKEQAALAQTFGNQAAMAIENARLFSREQSQRQRNATLLELMRVAASSLALDEVMQTILERTNELIPSSSGTIQLLEGNNLRVAATFGRASKALHIGEILSLKDFPLNKKTIKEKVPVYLPDTRKNNSYRMINRLEEVRSFLSVPLICKNQAIGLITLDSENKSHFSEQDIDLIISVARHAAIAIENARLFQEESRRSQIIEAMANIANEFATAQEIIPALDIITHRALGLLNASTVAIYLLQDDNKTIRVVSAQGTYREQLLAHTIQVGAGITGSVISSGKAEIVDDMLEDARRITVPGTPVEDAQRDTIMSAPLVLRGKTIGAINAWRNRSNGLFNESELNFLVSIANQTSMSIEAIRLFQETSRRAQEAHAVAEVGRDISSTLQLDIVLERIAQYAKDLLRAETSAVYLLASDEPLLQAIAAIGKESREIKDDPLMIGSGILGNIALQKSGEIVNDTLGDQRAIIVQGTEMNPNEHLMGVPVLSKDQLTGLLAVWRTGLGEEFKPYELDFLSSLAQQAAVAIENARLFEAEQRRHRESETLRQAALAINTSLELESVLETLLIVMKQVIPYSSASVMLQEGDELRLAAMQGFPTSESWIDHKFPAHDELYQEIKISKQPLILVDAQQDLRYKKWGASKKTRGWMGIPLVERGEVIGCITIDNSKANVYDFNAATLALAFAHQASTAIRNARQFESEQKHFEDAETLRQSAEAITSSLDIGNVLYAILHNLSQVVPYDSAALFLIDGNMVRLTAGLGFPDNDNVIDRLFPAENALLQEVWNFGQPLILEDAQADPRFEKWAASEKVRGWMGVPLSARGRMIGCITIDSFKPGAYNDHDATMAATFAHQAAVAIENARLYERSEHQVRQLTVLRDIDTAISSSFDLQVTLDFLLSHALKELDVDAAAILLYNPDLQALSPYSGIGFTNKRKSPSAYIRIGEGLAGRVALKRKFIHIPDLSLSEEEVNSSLTEESFKSYFGVPLIGKGEIKGVLEVYSKVEIIPSPDWLNFLHTLAGQAAIAIDNIQLFKNLQRSNQELMLAYDTTLAGWGKALELRDKETQGHTNRVVKLTIELARRMDMDGDDLTHILRGTLLHDIGKMGIPDYILNKPGPLTEEEWGIMRQHPQFAFDLMNQIPYLRPATDIPYSHHERWDGSGYPLGLKGEAIPLAARIFAIVDIYDALLNDRVYREAWSDEKVIEYLKNAAGIELDPTIVKKFLEMIQEDDYKDQAE